MRLTQLSRDNNHMILIEAKTAMIMICQITTNPALSFLTAVLPRCGIHVRR